MRILWILGIFTAMIYSSIAATTWPAGTNVANTFFQTNTFRSNTVFQSTLQLNEMIRPPVSSSNSIYMWVEDMGGLPALRVRDWKGLVLGVVRDNVWIGRCATPGGISKGDAVYCAGTANSNMVWIAKAKADSRATMPSVGLATEDIAFLAAGRILNNGLLPEVDTTNWNTGDILYVSDTAAGKLTNVIPVVPSLMQQIGFVQIPQTNGSIQVEMGSLLNDATGTGQTNWYFGPYGTNILSYGGSKINGVGFTNGVITGDGSGLTGVGVPNALTNLDSRAWTNSMGDLYVGTSPNAGSLFLWNDGDGDWREITTVIGGFISLPESISVGTNIISRYGAFYGNGIGITNIQGSNIVGTISVSQLNVGTLILTNPPTLDLSASTNLPGSGVVSAVTNAINAVNATNLIAPAIVVWSGPTNTMDLSYPYTKLTYTMASDISVTNFTGITSGFPCEGILVLTNSAASNCTARFPASCCAYGTAMTNNALVVLAGKKGMVSVMSGSATNIAGVLQSN